MYLDLIVFNGAVHTMDSRRPRCEALAVLGERVVAIGSNEEIRPLAGPQTKIIDAQGCLVLPGFNDAHVHFLMGGFSLGNVDLRSASTPEEMAARLAEHAKKLPKGEWVLGGSWDHERWPGAAEPTRSMIDAATPDHPVLVHRLDCHMALANSVALHMAGVTRSTLDVAGGVIVREPATGDPTGLLKDAGENLVTRMIPPKTTVQKRAAAKRATDYAASLGVTSVTDVSADADLALYQQMAAAGELKTRIYGARSIVSWEVAAQAGLCAGFGSTMVRTGLLKGFADGSLGSSTALFLEPYANAPGNRGLYFEQMLPAGTMLDRAVNGDAAGLQIAIHAIGDRANREILDLFEEVARRNGKRDRRLRIEHAQHLQREDIPRFAELGVIASMQPAHAADDGRWCEKRLGKARCETAYALRSLLDSGAILAFGSDWTVASLDPLTGIKAAVTRHTLDGQHPKGWVPQERITLQEAFYGYTMGSAYAEFFEAEKGSLTPGKLADLIVLDRNSFELPPAELDQARVRLTILGGKVVFEA